MAKASNTFIEIYEPPNFVDVPVIESDVPVAIVLPDTVITASAVVETAAPVDISLGTILLVAEEAPAQTADLSDKTTDAITSVVEPSASEGATP